MLAAGIRGAMSYYGIVGPFGSYLFMGVRLLIDQTLENWTGVGALPWYVYSWQHEQEPVHWPHVNRTWPVNEQIIDLLHKAVFAAVTGYVADRVIVGEALNAWSLAAPSRLDRQLLDLGGFYIECADFFFRTKAWAKRGSDTEPLPIWRMWHVKTCLSRATDVSQARFRSVDDNVQR
jgi:hypothetical protein